jgi:hypothetical protein
MAGHVGSKRCPVVASSRQVVSTLMDVTRGICLTQSSFFTEARICVRVAWEVWQRGAHVSKEYSATIFTVSVKLDALRFYKISGSRLHNCPEKRRQNCLLVSRIVLTVCSRICLKWHQPTPQMNYQPCCLVFASECSGVSFLARPRSAPKPGRWGGGSDGLQQPPQVEIKKKTHFVDTTMFNVSRDLPFSLNEPLKSAID